MATETEHPVEDVSHLYLSTKQSDFTIVVEGTKLPAHREILAERCEYFKTMFESGMVESVSNQIEVRETSVNSVKIALKWIYCGKFDYKEMNDEFETLRLAHMYGLTDLLDLVVGHIKNILCDENDENDEKVCQILNIALLLSLDDLVDYATSHMTNYVTNSPLYFLNHESFQQLSTDALILMLTRVVLFEPNADVFRAVVKWMKANPAKSADFPEVLNNVMLDAVPIGLLTDVPSGVFDAVVTLIRNKHVDGPVYMLKDEALHLRSYGVKVIAGDKSSFFDENAAVSNDKRCILKHEIGSTEEGIVVDLGRRFLLNSLELHLVDTDKKEFSYWIAVSEDNINWTRIIDYSKYTCRSFQKLHFKECAVRYLRICGTAPADGTFEITHFEASYSTDPFEVDPETNISIPSRNVASTYKHATVINGHSKPGNAIIDNTLQNDDKLTGYTWHIIGDECIIVQLPQPYLIDSMKLLLWDGYDRVYSYYVEVSTDQKTWSRVCSEERVASWREIRFDMQPVVFIKLTGTYNSIGNHFDCVHLECPIVEPGPDVAELFVQPNTRYYSNSVF